MDNLSFWGIFLMFTGIFLLARVILNFNLPLFKILAGMFFVLLGLKIMFGSFSLWPVVAGENEVFFKSVEIDASCELLNNYQLVFAQSVFDLTEMEIPGEITGLTITSVFSGSTVYLPAGFPVKINSEGVFARVQMPGWNLPLFGKGTYRSDDYDPDMPHLDVQVNVVFGNVVFMRKID